MRAPTTSCFCMTCTIIAIGLVKFVSARKCVRALLGIEFSLKVVFRLAFESARSHKNLSTFSNPFVGNWKERKKKKPHMSIFLHKEIGTHLLYTDPIFKSLLELQENLYGFHFVCKAFVWLHFVLSSNTTTIQKCTSFHLRHWVGSIA